MDFKEACTRKDAHQTALHVRNFLEKLKMKYLMVEK